MAEKTSLTRDAIRRALADSPKTIAEILAFDRTRADSLLDLELCNLALPKLQKLGEVEWSGKAWHITPAGRTILAATLRPAEPIQASAPEQPSAARTPDTTGTMARNILAWNSVIDSLENLKIGEWRVSEIKPGIDIDTQMSRLRNVLATNPRTNRYRWSVRSDSPNTIKVTVIGLRSAEQDRVEAVPKSAEPPIALAAAASVGEPSVRSEARKLVQDTDYADKATKALADNVTGPDTSAVIPSHVIFVLRDLNARIAELQAARNALMKLYGGAA
jgi:hypothetical protein